MLSAMDRLTADEAIARCEVLSVALAARADDAERRRRLHPDTVTDVEAADLWRLVVPTSLGGHGLGITTLADATRTLAQGDPASAWTISFLIMHNWLLTRFPAPARAEVFAAERPWALVPAPLAPTGRAVAVDGGLRVSGRWEWATGVRHADWVMVHAVRAEPEPATFFVLVPIGDVVVDDVWFMSGMGATGSDTVVIDDVFVPAHRTIPAGALFVGEDPVDGDGMAALPVAPVLAIVAAAPALGAAEAATEHFRAGIAERVLAYSLGDRAREQPVTQARLGAVLSELAACRANWDRAVALLTGCSMGAPLSIEQRVDVRLVAAATVRSARRIISMIGEGSGASVYRADSPLQRLQRDVEVLKGHVIFDWDRTTELAGRTALGIEPRPTDMI
jgi:3-hydroxy-9,10-secoandrosta-1,3,5(10)-triene-9,17-dione monooxygenase